MRRYVKTVGELICALQKFSPDTKIEGTWESIKTSIYPTFVEEENTVYLDVDEGHYAKEEDFIFLAPDDK